ncbi:MAG: NAD(P)-binding protein [Thermodesulfobacteriota bacterium]|jgi:NADPH-dependent glutamate synthase beta subunit-like oxidoreductase
MSEKKAFGPHIRRLYTYKELPIGSTSIGICDDVIKTGLWRFIRPVIKAKTPPCSEACPAGVDVRGFISLMKQGLFEEANQLYMEENPFPAICGRVCFHPCESSCNRKDFDKAVAIHALERFLSDFESSTKENQPINGRQVGIIGSGPSGMACAYYLAKLGHRVTVFEALEVVGGLLRTGIPSYRLPKEILDHEVEKLCAMGIEFKTGCQIDRGSWKYVEGFDAVFLAYGAGQDLPLNLTNMKDGKVISGLEFLKAINLKGRISLSQRVVVIGGGNAAIDAARVALRLGAPSTLIYRRSRNEMPAFQTEIDDALEEGVKMIYLASPVRIEAQGSVQRIECMRNRLGDEGPDGRRQPIPIEGSNFFVEADAILFATGEMPDISLLPEDIQVSCGLISVDGVGSTSGSGIFAGGDLIDQPRSVVHAIGSGKRAAIAIDRYLKGQSERGWLDGLRIGEKGGLSFKQYCERKFSQENKEVIHSDDLNFSYFTVMERYDRDKTPKEARMNFQEIYGNLTLEKALAEAQRCFSCGMCYFCDNCYLLCPDGSVLKQDEGPLNMIDYEYCKGCGICENECPVGVIDMEKET